MVKSLLVAALVVLSVAANGVPRPPAPAGWDRVGCAKFDRNEYKPFSSPAIQFQPCLAKCALYSNFAALGGRCWCLGTNGGAEVTEVTITPAPEDKCENFCLDQEPDTGICGDGVSYYDLYKKSDPGVTVIKLPTDPTTPTKPPVDDATPTPGHICRYNCTTNEKPVTETPVPCTGDDCSPVTGSGSLFSVDAITTSIALLAALCLV